MSLQLDPAPKSLFVISVPSTSLTLVEVRIKTAASDPIFSRSSRSLETDKLVALNMASRKVIMNHPNWDARALLTGASSDWKSA